MDSTNKRKRSSNTASEDKTSADGPNKRPHISEDFRRMMGVFEATPQPPYGSLNVNRLALNGLFSSSAPQSTSRSSKSTAANRRGASFDTIPLDHLIRPPFLFNPGSRPGNALTSRPIPDSFPLSPAVFPAPSAESETPTNPKTDDALVKGLEPLTDSSQPIRSGSGDPQAQVESSNDSAEGISRTTSQVPADIPQQELTPCKPVIQRLPMMETPSSPPYRLPTEGGTDDQSSHTSQDTNISDAAPAAQAEDSAKPLQLQDFQNRLKKENISSELKVKPHLTSQSSNPKMKSHEASSNLSKSSPNHPSILSQNRSAKKIRTPFRSPLFNKTLTGNQLQQQSSKDGPSTRAVQTNLSSALQSAKPPLELAKRGPLSRIKGSGTSAARAAFKSPLRADTGASGVSKPVVKVTSLSHKGGAASRNDPVQNQLQLLRRAVKIKESGEDDKLEVLVAKWKDVAKDVAWELWGLVKEGNVGDGADSRFIAGPGGGFGLFSEERIDRGWGSTASGARLLGNDGTRPGWAWDDAGEEKDTVADFAGASDGMEETNATEDEDEEPKVEERSMGAMLRQLGIAQETLGWDEEEGDFTEIAT